jgi:hypothetical protein
LEGRKIRKRSTGVSPDGRFEYQFLYRIDVFRAYLNGRGSNGKGLVRFYGPAAKRSRQYADRDDNPVEADWSEWETHTNPRGNTLGVGEINIT